MPPIVMPQAWTKLWGSNGVIMNLLDSVFPGSKVWLLFFVGFVMIAFVGIFINAIKQPIENMRRILALMGLLGALSLLLFGDMASLLIFETILIIGWAIMHKTYEHREAISKAASAILSRSGSKLPETLRKEEELTQTAGRTGPPDERLADRAERDVAEGQQDIAAAMQTHAESAEAAEELAQAEETAAPEQAAAARQAADAVKHLTEAVTERTTPLGIDETAHAALPPLIEQVRTFGDSLLKREIELTAKRETLGKEIITEDTVEQDVLHHAENLLGVIQQLSRNLSKNLGVATLAALKEKLAKDKAALKHAKDAAKSIEENLPMLGGAVAPNAAPVASIADLEQHIKNNEDITFAYGAKIKQVTAIIEKAQSLMKNIRTTLQKLRKNPALAHAKGDIAQNLTKLIAEKTHLEEAHREFDEKIKELESANMPAHNIPIELSNIIAVVGNTVDRERKIAEKLEETIADSYTEAEKQLIVEEQVAQQLNNLDKMIIEVADAINKIQYAGDVCLGRQVEDHGKVQDAIDQLNLEEQQEQQQLFQQTLQKVRNAKQALARAIMDEEKTDQDIEKYFDQMTKNLRDAYQAISQTEKKAHDAGLKELEGADKAMAKAQDAANRAA